MATPATSTTSTAGLNGLLVRPGLEANKTFIDSAVGQLRAISKPDETLIGKYTTLKSDIDIVLNKLDTMDATSLTASAKELNERLVQLNTEKETVLSGATKKIEDMTAKEIVQYTARSILNNIFIISIIAAFVLGGSIASHVFIHKRSFYKLFYAAYGGVFFPLSLAMGIISPPAWRAPLYPLIQRGEDEPDWTNYPGINIITGMFKYTPPDLDEPDTYSLMFRLLSILVVGGIGVGLFGKQVV